MKQRSSVLIPLLILPLIGCGGSGDVDINISYKSSSSSLSSTSLSSVLSSATSSSSSVLLSSSSSELSSTSSAQLSSDANRIAIALGSNWRANGEGSQIAITANGVQLNPTSSGHGAVFTYPAAALEQATIRLYVRPDAAFVNSGASLQPIAQIMGGTWAGEWNCWTPNAQLVADVDQWVTCVIDEAGTFNQSSSDIQIGIQASRGTGEPTTAAGSVLITQAEILLAGSAPISSVSSSSSSLVTTSSSSVITTSSSSVVSTSSVATSSSSAGSGGNYSNIPASDFIVVDQFGYLPELKKIAVVRYPVTGFDANTNPNTITSVSLVNLDTNNVVQTYTPSNWNGGATSAISGDKVAWVDFSAITTPGTYALVDVTGNKRSPSFKIASDVYKPVLRDAVRYFFYQRAGFAKSTPYADTGWTDTASHIGSCQDTAARLFTDKNNAGTARDVSGGWYDAGDYNKYTNWHADYLIALLHAYLENPSVWTDDFNIPESSNGVPDLIDEIKWGMDWLIKMQETNGAVLSIVGLGHENASGQVASPPSTAVGCSYYGPASTSASLSAAAAFALGAKVFGELNTTTSYTTYANGLKTRAENAWTWANANPAVIVHNNQGVYAGLGAGNQEVDDEGRALKKLRAAIYLFAATNNSTYHSFVTSNLGSTGDWVDLWNEENQLLPWLYYSNLSTSNASTASTFKSRYNASLNDTSNFGQITSNSDAYRAYLGDTNFTWGSNRSMSRKGSVFANLVTYQVGTHGTNSTDARNAAVGYLNYLHGTNPLGMVYLSNMYHLGVHKSVDEFYHSWFTDGSTQWDNVKTSTYGPAPGFLVGGPNPSFAKDSCCTSGGNGCWDKQYLCSVELVPPLSQPAMKSYASFNTSWPLNSWQVSENHNDYQVAYIRLLTKFTNN